MEEESCFIPTPLYKKACGFKTLSNDLIYLNHLDLQFSKIWVGSLKRVFGSGEEVPALDLIILVILEHPMCF